VATNIGNCNACIEQQNVGSQRKASAEYLRMLASIRLSEAALSELYMNRSKSMGSSSSLATPEVPSTPVPDTEELEELLEPFLISNFMTEDDVAHLVEVVWNGHSAVSGHRGLPQLTLVRWNRDIPLSPWNSILLTTTEARTHSTIEKSKLYSNEFVAKVEAKLAMARHKWTRLGQLEEMVEDNPHLRSKIVADGNMVALSEQITKNIETMAFHEELELKQSKQNRDMESNQFLV
jgi:hypothetical protein